ncbi:MAG: family 16 glycosylhydrolase [Phycisphaera sp.]|nr:family 16 glycosylhydrolase [Phycisphaera sp.]
MTTSIFNRLLIATLCCLPTTMAVAQETLVWSEEFNGSGAPNPEVWTHDLGDLGVNNEFQIYTDEPQNVRVAGGNLVIHARREANGQFTSGRIRSSNKVMFQYGTVEARIKIPDLANGLWPAFWTLGNDISSVGWPRCGEIDILEMGGGGAIADNAVNRRAYSTAHWDFYGDYASYGESRTTGVNLNEDFHLFRLEWTPTAIRTFVDGQQIWVMDISDRDAMSGHEFHAPHFLIINLAVGGWFTGINDPNAITAEFPAAYLVDYIRIYDNGHTILSGPGIDLECRGDFNGDGRVDAADLGLLAAAWNTSSPRYDLDDNGIVNAADLGLLLGYWGVCP